jgi:hypothetical protein
MAGAVSFAVTTVGIPNGSFPVITLAGAPAGVTAGSITIAGNAATLTLNVPASIPAGSYPMTISINYGRPITSNSFTLTVSPVGGAAPVITSQPSDVTVNAGQNAEFKIVATGATSYSWSQSTNGGVSWNVLNNGGIYSGTATATLTLTNVPANMNGYLYYCVAMSVTGSAASNTATLTVNPVATKSVSVGSMSGDVWAGTGGSVTFPVSTEGIANGSYSVTITGAPAGVTTGALTVSANAATLTINVAASVAAGPRLLTLTIDGATSNTFSLYVRPAGSTALPVFNAHPTDLTVTAGQDASFSISAIGATSVRWQLKTGATWTDLTNNNTYAGVTGAKLTIATAGTAMNGYQYRCIATNANGSTESNPATLTVEAAVTITLSLSTASLDFTTAAGSQTFAIASNTDWTVEKSAGAAWLTVSPSSGSNDRTVTVTVAASTAAAARTATLTIKGTGVSAQTITVSQNGTVANEELTMDNGQLKVWANDGMLYISGNASGKQRSVYNISGTLVASPNPSEGGELAIPLPGRGVYIVTDGSSAVKVAY